MFEIDNENTVCSITIMTAVFSSTWGSIDGWSGRFFLPLRSDNI